MNATRALNRMKPRAAFFVHCDRKKRGKHYLVVILRRRDQVPKAARLITEQRAGWSRTIGFCHAFTLLQRGKSGWRTSRLCGVVILAFGCIGSGYVSHEMTHAAHFRLIRQNKGAALDDDRVIEPLADMQGWLVAQFWTEFYKRFPCRPILLRKP